MNIIYFMFNFDLLKSVENDEDNRLHAYKKFELLSTVPNTSHVTYEELDRCVYVTTLI